MVQSEAMLALGESGGSAAATATAAADVEGFSTRIPLLRRLKN